MARKIKREKIIRDLEAISKKLEAIGDDKRSLELMAISKLLITEEYLDLQQKGEGQEANKAKETQDPTQDQ